MSEPVGNSPRQPLGSNSHKARAAATDAAAPAEPQEQATKIVTGKVIQRRPNIFKRAARNMVADDVTNIREFVAVEIIAPAVRNLVFDIISQGSHRLLYGTAARPRGVGAGSSSGPVSSLKRQYHNMGQPDPARTISRESAARHDFDDIILESRIEAEDVIAHLAARVDRYGSARVSDMYNHLGISADFTSQNWGWTNLSSAAVSQDRRGFLLDLPRPIALNRNN